MQPLLDGGWQLAIGFFIIFAIVNYGISWTFASDSNSTKSQYLVNDRKLGMWTAALSISASWIWAPAMFISAFKAWQQGWVAMTYFLGANMLSLILFAVLVNKVCDRYKSGFTLSDFMGTQHSERVRYLYWFTLLGLTVGAFATQLFAGGNFIALVTGLDYFSSTLLLSAVPLTYCLMFGFKSSVITDLAKMILLLVVGIGSALAVTSVVGIDTVLKGMNGIDGKFVSLFDANGWLVFSTFGLATAVGLLSAPFGDQALWQRAFAISDPTKRRSAFLWGTFFFILIPVSMAVIGFAAAGMGFKATNPQFTNLFMIAKTLPEWALMAFCVMILAGITSILDSKLSAVSSIAGHDLANKIWTDPTDEQSMRAGKISMLVLAVFSIAIANIPGITLVHLFLMYGALRASTLLPTMIVMITEEPLDEAGVFYGVLTSIITGWPLLAYGAFYNDPWITVAGSSIGVLSSGIISYSWTRLKS